MTTRSTRLGSMIVLAVATLLPLASAADDPEAPEILGRVLRTYADARSYRDAGTVQTLYTTIDGGRFNTTKTFSTAFRRPDRFRFVCQGDQAQKRERYIIWRDGARVGHWSSRLPEVVMDKSFEYAVTLAVQRSISDRAADTVASLLMPRDLAGYRLDAMTELRRLEDDTLGGERCFRIEGESFGAHRVLWIAQTSYLVRRLEERSSNGTTETERTTTYEPVLNSEIDDASLAFPSSESK